MVAQSDISVRYSTRTFRSDESVRYFRILQSNIPVRLISQKSQSDFSNQIKLPESREPVGVLVVVVVVLTDELVAQFI